MSLIIVDVFIIFIIIIITISIITSSPSLQSSYYQQNHYQKPCPHSLVLWLYHPDPWSLVEIHFYCLYHVDTSRYLQQNKTRVRMQLIFSNGWIMTERKASLMLPAAGIRWYPETFQPLPQTVSMMTQLNCLGKGIVWPSGHCRIQCSTCALQGNYDFLN